MSAEAFAAWRGRAHERVCVPARTCTCPVEVTQEVLADARKRAAHIHARYEHPGPLDACQSPHDVICKAVW